MLSVWRSHKWEPLLNNFTKDYKILICVKQYIILPYKLLFSLNSLRPGDAYKRR